MQDGPIITLCSMYQVLNLTITVCITLTVFHFPLFDWSSEELIIHNQNTSHGNLGSKNGQERDYSQ